MNWDQIEGNWNTYRGMIQDRWARLTENDLEIISGRRDQLVGYVQKTYGVVRADAEHQVSKFLTRVSS